MQFKIHNMTRNENDGVTSVIWIAFITDDGVTVSKTGESVFTPNPSDSTFIPFENLTESQVIDWIKASENVDALKTMLDSELAVQIKIANKTGIPWINA